ncbi:hypothetical protein TWF506_005171 [Arthrobotrys conoides]|uniref:Uncharacterized protein n=1 Tax=Arthrobotrys conoides TaxID=74498 RepID=A0AAN8S2J2_9PEZI
MRGVRSLQRYTQINPNHTPSEYPVRPQFWTAQLQIRRRISESSSIRPSLKFLGNLP